MAVYKHVLCATDLSERAPALGGHAVDLAFLQFEKTAYR